MPAMDSRTSSMPRPWRVELDQRGEANQRDHQRAAVADLLETAAVTGQRVAFDGRQQFAFLQRGPIWASDEIGKRHAAPAARGGQLDRGLMRNETRRGVGGGRGIDDIAADRRLRPDLVVGEPDRAAGHGRQRAGKLGVVEKALDRRGSAEAHAVAVHAAFVELGDFGHVDQRRNMHVPRPALARPRISVGAARDHAITPAVLRHRGEGFIERSRRQVGVAGEHSPRRSLLVSSPAKAGDPVTTTVHDRHDTDYWVPRLRGGRQLRCYSAACFWAASGFAFTTTLMASSTLSLA